MSQAHLGDPTDDEDEEEELGDAADIGLPMGESENWEGDDADADGETCTSEEWAQLDAYNIRAQLHVIQMEMAPVQAQRDALDATSDASDDEVTDSPPASRSHLRVRSPTPIATVDDTTSLHPLRSPEDLLYRNAKRMQTPTLQNGLLTPCLDPNRYTAKNPAPSSIHYYTIVDLLTSVARLRQQPTLAERK